MIEWEQTMEIKILRRQGKSLRQIAQETGLSINTVRKYLSYEGAPEYRKKAQRKKKLDPYMNYIEKRVKIAHPLRIPVPVLLRKIKEKGYEGGLTQLKVYVRSLKGIPLPKKIIRFGTPPGQQMQVDWIEFRKKDFLAPFTATLGFSRMSFVHFVTNEKLETLIECHEQAFEYFGGVPYQVLYDNMKTVILERDKYGPGKHRFNAGMLDFAKHYSFQLKVCRPYRAKTKGKVERFNRYVRHSFYNPLVTQLKMEGLSLNRNAANIEVLKWLRDVANVRIHGTTGLSPFERFEEEKKHLQTLPRLYPGKVKAAPPLEEREEPELFFSRSLQHPLSIYQQILEAL